MKSKLRIAIPICMLIIIAGLIVGIILLAEEAKRPKETRDPAKIAIYYYDQKDNLTLLCEFTKDGEEKSRKLAYTGEAYSFVVRIVGEREMYTTKDLEIERRGYKYTAEGDAEEFTAVSERGFYRYRYGIDYHTDYWIPMDVFLTLEVI